MASRRTKSVAVAMLAIAALAIGVLPSFAAPASQHYQVSTAPKLLPPAQPLNITATIKQASPNCAYSVLITVTGPGGVSATDSITVNTLSGGNGHTTTSFPSDYSGTANTDTAGTYTVTATFSCGYATGSASTTFTVSPYAG